MTDDLLRTMQYLSDTTQRLSVCHLKLEAIDVETWPPELIDSVTKQAEVIMHWVLGNWDEVVPMAREWSDREVTEMKDEIWEWRRENGLDGGGIG